jgi:proteasome accessory factor C
MERGEVPVAEAARHFRITEAELVGDLELAAMCGLPPYIDEMIDVFIDEGTIFVGVPRLFTRPLRLTTHEAFALLATAEAASALPGSDPGGALDRALDKVRAKLGGRVEIEITPPPFTAEVRSAVERCGVLAIRYWTASRDEVTERRIVPRAVFEERGDFYVEADDERSGETRTFRIDRIQALTDTGETAAARAVTPRAGDWFADANDVGTAVLVLDADARWVAERYPVRRRTELPDGGLEIEMPVVSERWLGRLLLRLGASARLKAPAHLQHLGVDTARAVLARYQR